jgi:hypothetical protein
MAQPKQKPKQSHLRGEMTIGLKLGNALIVFASRASRRHSARAPTKDAIKKFLVTSNRRRQIFVSRARAPHAPTGVGEQFLLGGRDGAS